MLRLFLIWLRQLVQGPLCDVVGSVKTSVSSSVSDASSFTTIRTSVESLVKQWPTIRP